MPSPHRPIPPPIKRSRILVSSGVQVVISVNLYVIKSVAATLVAVCSLPENSVSRHPPTKAKSGSQQPSLPALKYRLVTSKFPVPAYHFWLFTQTASCSALKRRTFSIPKLASKRIHSLARLLTDSKMTFIMISP